MNHNDYKALSGLLIGLSDKYALFSDIFEKGKDGGPTDKAKGNPLFPRRFELLGICESERDQAVAVMDSNVDSFVQDLRDAHTTPEAVNPDIVSLVGTMTECSSRMATEIRGIGSLFTPIVNRCNEWLQQCNFYIPTVKAKASQDQATHTAKGITFSKDGKELQKYFKPDFAKENPYTKQNPFDTFLSCLMDESRELCEKDILRIARIIQEESEWFMPRYKREPFTKWVKLFCNALGIDVPKYIKKPLDEKDDNRVGWIKPFLK